jgi:hypothetical protein
MASGVVARLIFMMRPATALFMEVTCWFASKSGPERAVKQEIA